MRHEHPGRRNDLRPLVHCRRRRSHSMGSDRSGTRRDADSGRLRSPRTRPAYDPATWCRTAGADVGAVGHYAPTPSTMSGRNPGCDMSTQAGATTFGPWFTAGVGEVIRWGVTAAAPGAMPTAADYDPP